METAQALFRQASDLKASGSSRAIDVLRAQVQIQNQRQRSIVAQNEFEKAKLQLARAIGLPPGQAVQLTDKIPYAPLDDRHAGERARARPTRTAPTTSPRGTAWRPPRPRGRAAAAELLPSLQLDADYGTIGQRPSNAHPTYTVGAQPSACPIFEAGKAQAQAHRGRRD